MFPFFSLSGTRSDHHEHSTLEIFFNAVPDAIFGCPKLRSFETVAMSKKRIEVDIVSDIA